MAEGEDGPWQLHAEGRLVAPSPAVTGSHPLPPAGAEPLDVSALYDDLADLGYDYGPTFQGIKQAWHVGGQVWARASLPETAEQSAARFGLHPALLDSAMHSLLLTQRLQSIAGEDLFVPFEAAAPVAAPRRAVRDLGARRGVRARRGRVLGVAGHLRRQRRERRTAATDCTHAGWTAPCCAGSPRRGWTGSSSTSAGVR